MNDVTLSLGMRVAGIPSKHRHIDAGPWEYRAKIQVETSTSEGELVGYKRKSVGHKPKGFL